MAQKRSLTVLTALACLSSAGAPVYAQTAPTQTPNNATTISQAAPATAPAVPTAPDPDLLEAQAVLAAGQYDQARKLFERYIARDFENAEAHFGLGLALYALGDLPGARFEFTQMIRLAPERYEGYYNLGVIAVNAAEYDVALTQLGKAAELSRGKAPPSVARQILDALAAEHARKSDYGAQAKTLAEATELTPDDLVLRLALARALHRADQGPEALPHAYAVLQAQPGYAPAALLLADIYEAQKLTDRAIRELDKALAVKPTPQARVDMMLRKAELQYAMGEAQRAAQTAFEATKLAPNDARLYALMGETQVARGHLENAAVSWKRAAELAPTSALYHANLASVQLATGQYAAAAVTGRRAEQLATDDTGAARAQVTLGIAAYRTGKYQQARAALQAAALKAPTADAYLWLGLSEYALKNYPQAVTALEASVKTQPSLIARENLGSALLAAGRVQEAEATLRGVVAEAPRNAEAWYQLGWSVRAQGREDEAKAAFQSAAKLGHAKARGVLR